MNRCKTYKSSNAQQAAEPNGIMPIRNSRPTLCGESGTGSPQRDGCVVFVSPQTCVHLAQMGDSKRADNSDCLSYSVRSEIGNRRALQGAPALSPARRGQSYTLPEHHPPDITHCMTSYVAPARADPRARGASDRSAARAAVGEFVLCAGGGTIDTSVCGGIGVRGSDRGLGADPFVLVYPGRRNRVASLASRPTRLRYSTDTAHDPSSLRVREGETPGNSLRIFHAGPGCRDTAGGNVSCAHR